MTRKITGGAAVPVQVISDSDLKENGGNYHLESKTVTYVNRDVNQVDEIEGGVPLAVYSVSDAQIESGEFILGGGAALPVVTMASGEYQPRKRSDKVAIPVYPIEGSGPIISPNPNPPPPFVPTDIAGLLCWYEDDREVYQQAAGPITPASDIGDPVGYWGDLTGNGNHLTSLNPPTRQANGITFDGTNDYLESLVNSADHPTTVIMAATPLTGSSLTSDTLVSTTGWYIRVPGASSLVLVYNNTNLFLSAPAISLNTTYIITAVLNNASSVVGLNDTEESGDSGNGSTHIFNLRLARNVTGSSYQPCRFLSLIIYAAVLNPNQRQQVRNYLNERYSVY